MNEEQSIFDLIERYHQGLLSEEEKALVEKRMQTDAPFAEYVKVNGLTNVLVHSAGIDMLRETMSKDLARFDQQKNTQTKWKIGMGIASALLISGSAIYFIQNTEKKDSSLPGIQQEQPSTNKDINNNIVPETTVEKSGIINPALKQSEEKSKTDTTVIKSNATSFVSPIEKKDTINPIKTVTKEEYRNSDQSKAKEENQKEIQLSFDVIVQASCKGELTGTIAIDRQSLSGGVKPYRFQISNSNKESSTGTFAELGKGNYTITMYDSKAHSYSKGVTVPEKNCTSKKSYSINPDYGEVWKIPSTEGESGSFTIYNKAGITIFKGNFTAQGSAEWTGINSMGVTVDAGLYVCILEYSNGKSEIIEISIIR